MTQRQHDSVPPADMFIGVPLSTFSAVMQLLVERKHQDAKYPSFVANYAEMSVVLLQEVGELATELGALTWPMTWPTEDMQRRYQEEIRQAAIDEAIDVAAVAIRIVEHLTREGSGDPV